VRLVVSPAASNDIARLHDFLAATPTAARRAAATLNAAIESLHAFPDRGRPCEEVVGARELVVPFGRSAYVLRYAHLPDADEVVILRVWHGREVRE
jgi:plasmid stabilization system protein ParE